jgi:hypothetical protein
MRTGPEHYAMAEKLLGAVDEYTAGEDEMAYVQARIARAQVHATLALAVATRPDITRGGAS